MSETVNENINQESEESQAPVNVDLNINDLGTLKNIIDLASSRAAFKPNEMAVVGQTYNRLVAFLDQVAKHQAAQNAEKEGEKEAE